MTKALEQILSKEFEARDARLIESQPKREARISKEAEKYVARYGGTVDEAKKSGSYYADRLNTYAHTNETKIAVANTVHRYLGRNAYVTSAQLQTHIDTLSPEEKSKTWRAIHYPKSPMKYRTNEARFATPGRNPYFKRVVGYMPLSEAVRLAAGLGKNVEVNTKGNKNDIIFFKDKKKMLKTLKGKIKGAPREIKMQFDLKL